MTEERIPLEEKQIFWEEDLIRFFPTEISIMIRDSQKGNGEKIKSQILSDYEIVNRLRENIKEIESFQDKDTLYTGHIELINRCLPILQKILGEK